MTSSTVSIWPSNLNETEKEVCGFGIVAPDATILMRGLLKMMKRVLESVKNLEFGLQLARNTSLEACRSRR